jgi:hypothetical protein
MTPPKASKLMYKPYYLANEKTGERITVRPPKLPGINGEPKDKKKNEKGEWIRRFDILDTNGVKQFEGQTFIVMTHMPRAVPFIMINDEKWSVQPIGKEPTATKKVEPAPAKAEATKPKSLLDQATADIRQQKALTK